MSITALGSLPCRWDAAPDTCPPAPLPPEGLAVIGLTSRVTVLELGTSVLLQVIYPVELLEGRPLPLALIALAVVFAGLAEAVGCVPVEVPLAGESVASAASTMNDLSGSLLDSIAAGTGLSESCAPHTMRHDRMGEKVEG